MVENVVDSIQSNQHESFLLLSICYAGSRFVRCNSVRIELSCNMRIESNRKVPQTNRLSLGVLDMDCRPLMICKNNLRNKRVTPILDKERCIKNEIFFDLLYVSYICVTC